MSGTSFAEATAVTPVDSHTYEVDLHEDWTVGSVPHGGYVTAVFLRTTAQHFSSSLSRQDQPHCLALHLSFLRRTSIGPARLTISDAKLGGQTSTLHVTLSQTTGKKDDSGNAVLRPCVAGYITHANLNRPFTGGLDVDLSLPTHWKLNPPPAPVDLTKLASGEDANWSRVPPWYPDFRKAYTRFEAYGPRVGQPQVNIMDEWVRMENSPQQRITQETIGCIVDMFPLMIDNFRTKLTESGTEQEKQDVEKWPLFWCPTVLLNLDVKKVLPEEGVQWLFVRVSAKKMQGGRMDYEVVVMDEGGDLVALSHHVVLVLTAARNIADRGTGQDGSKI